MLMNIMKIQILDQTQVAWVYETHMTEDFPRDELKPLKVIRQMMEEGMYDCLGLYRRNELAAYALLVKNEQRGTLLLDYLAVTPDYRNAGMGSIFMQQLQRHYAGRNAVLLECESESSAPDEEQLQIRKRRISFYIRNGCRRTGVKSSLFDVDYEILYLPLNEIQINPETELEALYRLTFPAVVMDKRVRLWTRHQILSEVSYWRTADHSWRDAVSLCAALGIGTGKGQAMPRFISFVGAGGKTSTMYQLADELAECGCKVLVTTSTHIGCPDRGPVAGGRLLEAAAGGDWKEGILTAGILDKDSGKLAAPEDLMDAEAVGRILEKADVILVEADGAKQYPLKVPAGHEPVLAPQTDMVIACAGLTAIGKTFAEGCFRFQQNGGWLHRKPSDLITAEDAALILMDERGSRKGVSGLLPCRYRVVLNQADHDGRKEEAGRLVRLLPEFMKSGCVLTAYERKEREHGDRE